MNGQTPVNVLKSQTSGVNGTHTQGTVGAQVRIAADIARFDSDRWMDALRRAMDLASEHLKLLRLKAGSVIATIALPGCAADRLKTLVDKKIGGYWIKAVEIMPLERHKHPDISPIADISPSNVPLEVSRVMKSQTCGFDNQATQYGLSQLVKAFQDGRVLHDEV